MSTFVTAVSETLHSTPQLSPQGRQTALLTTVLVIVFTAEVDLASFILEIGLLSSGLEQLRRLEFLRSGTEL